MGEGRTIALEILDGKDSVEIDELAEHIMLMQAVRSYLDVEWTESVAAFDARNGHKVFGFTSTVSFLKQRCGLGGARAKSSVAIARAAHRFQATLASWKHRQISSDEAVLLFRTAERMPDKYPEAENTLLEIVGEGYDDTRKVLDYWCQTADQPGVIVEEHAQLLRRRFEISRRRNGMVEGEFTLTSSAGESLMVAIDALLPPVSNDDDRTPTQRRADALEDLSRVYLETTETPEVGGEKPHINIHVDLNALEGNAGGLHETETGSVLTVTTVRQLACDASVSRIIWNPESEIIDVGRKTRTIPAATRRALIARDRHCVMPGCHRNPRWADAHHITHWADGGTTNLNNLVLLCRYHHTLVHQDPTYELVLLEHIQQTTIPPPT